MTPTPNILAIIPARGGSKGLPRKNVRLLDDIPLVLWVARAARSCGIEMDLILSTDDPEIADVAGKGGLAMHGLRPAELSTDTASSSDVAVYETLAAEQRLGGRYDNVLLLQPTCPFTRPETIAEAVRCICSMQVDFVGTATEVIDSHPAYMLSKTNDGRFAPAFSSYGATTRQLLPAVYTRAGNVYATRRDALVANGALIHNNAHYVIVDREEAVNINTVLDWHIAEAVIASRNARNA